MAKNLEKKICNTKDSNMATQRRQIGTENAKIWQRITRNRCTLPRMLKDHLKLSRKS